VVACSTSQERAVVDLDAATRMLCPQIAQQPDLLAVGLAEVEVAQPGRLVREHQPGRPVVGAALRPGEAIDVGAVLGDQDEVVQVALDQLGLVLRP
jgi:hypothetical protein